MQIRVTLDGGAGELDSTTFEVADNHPDQQEAVNAGALKVIERWVLSAGDTIMIREV